MNSFKSFVKNIADKAPDFASPSKGGVSGASALPEDGAEGFICPICMKGFMNPDDLQIHFERDHGDGEDKSLKHDVKELQTTLKEEQFYSAELKREVERLSDAVHHKDLADQDEEKVMLQSQVEALQMGKDVLSREVDSLRKALELAETKAQEASGLMDGLKDKLSTLSSENVTLKAELDEATSDGKVAREKARVLESVLEQRNNSDDVAVLRHELHNVQKLMMDDIQEIKTDTKLEDLRAENLKLTATIDSMAAEKSGTDKEALKAYEDFKAKIAELQTQIETMTSRNQELTKQQEILRSQTETDLSKSSQELRAQQEKLETNQLRLKELERERGDLSLKLKTLQDSNADLKAQCDEKSNSLEDALRHKSDVQDQLTAHQAKVESLTLELDRVKSEREDLMSNIEAKEGINTALQQLKVENESLNVKLKESSEQNRCAAEEHRRKVDELFVNINDGKSKLGAAHDQLTNLQGSMKDLQAKMQGLEGDKSKMESEITSKNGQIKDIEESKSELKKSHQKEVAKLTEDLKSQGDKVSSLEAKCSDLDGKQRQAAEVKKSLEEELEKLKSACKSEVDKVHKLTKECSLHKDSVKKLNADLELKSANFDAAQKEIESLKANVAEAQSSSASKVDELHSKIRGLEEDISSFKEATVHQSQTISNLEENLQSEKNKVSSFEQKIKDLNDEIKQKADDVACVVGAMEEENKGLKADLKSKNAVLDDLGTKNSELIDQVSKLTDSLATSNFEVTKIKENYAKAQVDFDKEKALLEESISDLTKAKDLLLTSKVDIQSQLEESEKLSVKLNKQIESEKQTAVSTRADLESKLASAKQNLDRVVKKHQSDMETKNDENQALTSRIESLESDASQHQSKMESSDRHISDLNTQLESLIGERLELEAKVGSSDDEIRSLLERCLAAETELDRSKSNVVELRRKLDDSQAALHELGRENQSIQVELAKQTGRKWADDAEVTECMTCKNGFSLTNRKHHCRNCGQIFCNDCSAKQTMMPNYKKPQRVCDPCYAELQLPGAQGNGRG